MKVQKSAAPIKRSQALINFSREHHFGLLLVWKIRQGIKNNVAPTRIAEYVLHFFEHDLRKHFEAEERLLFPKLAKDSVLQQTVLREHGEVYDLIGKISRDRQNSALQTQLADTLEKHIRYEERTLFNELQKTLTEAEMSELAEKHDHVTCDVSENWSDKFWEGIK